MVGFPLAEAPREDKEVATGIVRTIVLPLVVLAVRLWRGAGAFKVEFCKAERRKGHNKIHFPLRTLKSFNRGVFNLPLSGLRSTRSQRVQQAMYGPPVKRKNETFLQKAKK